MVIDDQVEAALSDAWHEQTARNSIERWLQINDKEHWDIKSSDLKLLIKIFGSSWYFTRIIFSNGLQAVEILGQSILTLPDRNETLLLLLPSLDHDDLEARLDHLRLLKNNCMLKMLVHYLQCTYSLQQLEYSLSLLAEATLEILVRSLQLLPQHKRFPVTILAMGRMAGYEMTFGSDLDLIFLYDGRGEESYEGVGKSIRLLLRTMAQPSAAGSLFDVDMRLRPHGNAGPLVTPFQTFIEHHAGNREVWEKQMMTRCRPILEYSENADAVLQEVREKLYIKYNTDFLKQEIRDMRKRVQKELGSPKGKYEIKRGYGGIMDIDFISHYFQLGFGYQYSELQTCSTRLALQICANLKLIDAEVAKRLHESYNYLKKVELCLRLFDMKSIDTFQTNGSNNAALSRAMGHGNNIRQFQDEYESVTHTVRNYFTKLLV